MVNDEDYYLVAISNDDFSINHGVMLRRSKLNTTEVVIRLVESIARTFSLTVTEVPDFTPKTLEELIGK